MYYDFDTAAFATDLAAVFKKHHVTQFGCDGCTVDIDGETLIDDFFYRKGLVSGYEVLGFKDNYDGSLCIYESHKE